jgi:tryptophan-rich sensory protein
MEKTIATPVDDGCRFKTPSYRITRGWAKVSEPAVGTSKIALAVVWGVLSVWVAVDWADIWAEYPHTRHARVKKKCFAGIPASSGN